MKPLVEKVLKSGLVDKSTAEIMEKMGLIPAGASDQVREEALNGATYQALHKLADEMAEIVERESAIRETHLDLKRIRWPVTVNLEDRHGLIVENLPGVVDHVGIYYFRFEDVVETWFAPGRTIRRHVVGTDRVKKMTEETIIEFDRLCVDSTPICVRVATRNEVNREI